MGRVVFLVTLWVLPVIVALVLVLYKFIPHDTNIRHCHEVLGGVAVQAPGSNTALVCIPRDLVLKEYT